MNKIDYQKIEKYFIQLRSIVLVFSVFIFIGVSLFYLIIRQKNQRLDSLLEKKKVLLESLQNKKDNEAKLIYAHKKYEAMTEFLKDDALFAPYYDRLSSTLTISTESSQIRSFAIDQQRNIQFKINFTNYQKMTEFFKFIESDKFLKDFESLSLKSFSALNSSTSSESANIDKPDKYELVFFGKFREINETKN